MKSLLTSLAACVLLCLSASALAQLDCSKSPNPKACETLKAAESACKDKQGAQRMACIKAKLAEANPKK